LLDGGVTEALVIAAPDPILGEVPEAFVVGALVTDIDEYDFDVRPLPYLPRNDRGKLIRDRDTLLKLAERRRERAT
jgi:acyl-coenzyme A synthetase/AMP-(fatty) acid ligase